MSESKESGESIILKLNKQAMESLRDKNYEQAYYQLTKAKEKLEKLNDAPKYSQLWSITLNNFGCYFKRIGQPAEALNYLTIALEKENRFSHDVANLAGTHLNMSAILSQLGNHEKALSHAVKALKALNTQNEKKTNHWVSVAIAYHSMGLEYDYLSQRMESLKAYRTGWELAKNHLGESHQLTISLKRSCLSESEHAQSLDSVVVKRKKNSSRNSSSPRTDAFTPRKRGNKKAPHSVPAKKSLGYLPRINTSWSNSKRNSKKLVYYKENSFDSEMSKYWNFEPELQMRPTFTAPLYRPLVTPPLAPPSSSNSFRKRKYEALSLIENELRNGSEDTNSTTLYTKSTSSSIDYQKPSVGIQADLNKEWSHDSYKMHQSKAASAIQRTWRKYRALKKIKLRIFNRKIQTAQIKAQRAMDELENLRREKQKIAIKQEMRKYKQLIPIPFKSKTSLYCKDIRMLQTIPESRLEDQNESIKMIQAYIRMWLARKKYLKMKESAIIIQKNVRMHQIQNLYKAVLGAAIFIQSVFRGYRTRKLYKFLIS